MAPPQLRSWHWQVERQVGVLGGNLAAAPAAVRRSSLAVGLAEAQGVAQVKSRLGGQL